MPISWKRGSRNGLETVEIATAASTAALALQGAQVLSFAPRGEPDWLWISARARWEAGVALRGGIPICFPWFGPHPADRNLPSHGFARLRAWQLAGVEELADGRARAELLLASDGATAALYPHPFEARLSVTVGVELALAFEVVNTGAAPLAFEVALHTYFAVCEVAAIAVEGLASAAGRVTIDGEVDRVYDEAGRLTLVDPVRPRRLALRSGGAGSTVVWNPGPAKAAALADMAPDGYRGFVCVETGNVRARRVTLAPGERHATSVEYSGAATRR